MTGERYDSYAYARAEVFLRRLKRYVRDMDVMTYDRLRQTALRGHINDAQAELEKIVKRKQEGD